MLRTFGRTTTKLRAMAGDFQKQFNEALKEAELDDVKKSVDQLRSLNPASEIRKQLNPFEKAAADIRSGLDSLKPAPAAPSTTGSPANPADPASAVVHPAEPLKNGAAGLVGVSGPEAMPATPVFPASNATPAPPVIACRRSCERRNGSLAGRYAGRDGQLSGGRCAQPGRKRPRSRSPGRLPRNRQDPRRRNPPPRLRQRRSKQPQPSQPRRLTARRSQPLRQARSQRPRQAARRQGPAPSERAGRRSREVVGAADRASD